MSQMLIHFVHGGLAVDNVTTQLNQSINHFAVLISGLMLVLDKVYKLCILTYFRHLSLKNTLAYALKCNGYIRCALMKEGP